ncbi:multimeric flavodoxin WrbA [Acetivibrio thermocellus AD2]|jgi:multimeric flavodoxin WrbA|uniref:Multimeric flavodoxin WrbA n=1 Tax=Acetivibrio thermocellus AD2 TaxID=1138384 RepID=A0AB36TFP2_ACETH|nr:flavodoxin family protein [Acetivibrio thermocellus]CDG35563.1 NADPH-dependent FMN reductase [Acetivibrio thermocellus BC1]ADU74412.1 NADPH-dependent FMN reductase [Acetivibrio thermocellus DSM 1313]ALX08355.1 NADPH-dependent FMN reductase [Acetivibrio thermocellus AD2]ANV76104.1 NADPH-dependent FMN reductase [Acetivibrio thermocellus DSM 2360]EIC05784.1 NADPH-dependent FMN reductase [Acetivibrio thermocellus YS]
MLIVGINGSPKKEGNTKYLINTVLEEAKSQGVETMVLEVGELLNSVKNPFCVVCSNPCSGICYKGTKLEEAYEILKKADAIVMGSPVYFGSVSAQLKAFFDKTRKLRSEKALYNKFACGVTVGGARFGGQETTMKALHDIMLVHGMTIVGDGYVGDDCGHHGVCAQQPADKDEFAIKRAKILGRRLVDVCKKAGA